MCRYFRLHISFVFQSISIQKKYIWASNLSLSAHSHVFLLFTNGKWLVCDTVNTFATQASLIYDITVTGFSKHEMANCCVFATFKH